MFNGLVPGLSNLLKSHSIDLFRDVMESQYECNGTLIYQKEIFVQDPYGYLLRFAQNNTSNDK